MGWNGVFATLHAKQKNMMNHDVGEGPVLCIQPRGAQGVAQTDITRQRLDAEQQKSFAILLFWATLSLKKCWIVCVCCKLFMDFYVAK